MDQRPTVKPETLKLIEIDIGIGKNFLIRTLLAQVLRSAIDKLDCINLKHIFTTKKQLIG